MSVELAPRVERARAASYSHAHTWGRRHHISKSIPGLHGLMIPLQGLQPNIIPTMHVRDYHRHTCY